MVAHRFALIGAVLVESEIGPTAIRAYGSIGPSSHRFYPRVAGHNPSPAESGLSGGASFGQARREIRTESLPFRPVALLEQTGHAKAANRMRARSSGRSQPWVETQNAPSWNVLSAISLTPASATTPSPSTRAAVATCATTES